MQFARKTKNRKTMPGLDFKSEKEFQGYLVANADKWAVDFFGAELASLDEQWYMRKLKRFGGNKPRIDIRLKLKNGRTVGVEVKNPSQAYSELSRSISQLLGYAVLAEEGNEPFDELAIITSAVDPILSKIVKKFNLPVRIFVVTREIHGEFK